MVVMQPGRSVQLRQSQLLITRTSAHGWLNEYLTIKFKDTWGGGKIFPVQSNNVVGTPNRLSHQATLFEK